MTKTTIFRAIVLLMGLANAAQSHGDPIHDAAKANDADKVKAILKSSPDAIKATDPFGRSPLGVAANAGQKQAAIALIAAGADVNFRDNFLQTPIFWALMNGHTELVELLLQHKADPNAKARNGETPLGLAKRHNNTRAIELLQKRGAKE